MNTPKATKQGTDFYTMLHLFYVADLINKSLCNDKKVGGTVKYLLGNVRASVKVMMNKAFENTPTQDVETFKAEWERDYLSYLAIFEKMAEMTDYQREVLEEFAEDLIIADVKPIDNTKNND